MKRGDMLLAIGVLIFLLTTINSAQAIDVDCPDEVTVNRGSYETFLIELECDSDNETLYMSSLPNINSDVVLSFKEKPEYVCSSSGDSKGIQAYIFADDDAETDSYEKIITAYNKDSDSDTCSILFHVNSSYYDICDDEGCLLTEDSKIEIGSEYEIVPKDIGTSAASIIFTGCGSNKTRTLIEDEENTIECNGDEFRITLLKVYDLSEKLAKIEILSKKSYSTDTISKNSNSNSGDCVLGISTVTEAYRGKVFAFEVIDINTNKVVPDASVIVSDVGAEADTKHEVSDRTGYVQFIIDPSTVGPMTVRVSKDGCEATNKKITFGTSYDDYKKDIEEQQKQQELTLNLPNDVFVAQDNTFTVENKLGESVEGVDVEITETDDDTVNKTTDSKGQFVYRPPESGKYTVSIGKSGYDSPEDIEFTAINRQGYSILAYAQDGNNVINAVELEKGKAYVFKLIEQDTGKILNISTTALIGTTGIPVQITNGQTPPFVINTKENPLLVKVQASGGYDTKATNFPIKGFPISLEILGIIIIIAIIILLLGIIITRRRSHSRRPMSIGKGMPIPENPLIGLPGGDTK